MTIENKEWKDATPEQLGLPGKFKGFRSHQTEALKRIGQSKARIILCQAPTGSGKTLIMSAVAKHFGKPMIYTCFTKQLQQQVARDFPYSVELKGRANYPCLKDGELTCADCSSRTGNKKREHCLTCEFTSCDAKKEKTSVTKCLCVYECPYELQKQKARESELTILNTPFFLNEANYVNNSSFSGWSWVVLDEGDLTEGALMDFIKVSVTKRMLGKLGLGVPSFNGDWKLWSEKAALPALEKQLGMFDREPAITHSEIREEQSLERVRRKLRWFAEQDMDNWIFISSEDEVTWKPVFVSRYADYNLWRHGERFLLMSATIISPAQTIKDLGLNPEETEFFDIPSTFPVENRPIYVQPAADMSNKNKERAWPEMVKAIDRVIAEHPKEKGLVHTVSYPLARYIYENSEHRKRMMQHSPETRVQSLEEFKAARRPLVMVSPSMDRGVDLPDDLCRFVIISKVPYPYLGDPQVARRLYHSQDGHLWYAVQTIRSLVQMTGRGVRSETDTCKSYILDANFTRLYSRNQNLFPAWWREALR